MRPFEKWSVWVTSALTAITGAGYFWTKYLVESTDPFSVVNHPLEPWFLKAHILVSPLLLLALGMILLRHVWLHYRRGMMWGRKSGILAGLFLLPMVLTGYLIQAVTDQGWLQALAIAHIATGLLYLVGLVTHEVAIRVQEEPPPDRRRLYSIQRERRLVGAGDQRAGDRAGPSDPSGEDEARMREEDLSKESETRPRRDPGGGPARPRPASHSAS